MDIAYKVCGGRELGRVVYKVMTRFLKHKWPASFFVLMLVFLGLIGVVFAASSSWTQTDWSDGAGSNTSTEFLTSTNINYLSSGEIKLNTLSGWFNDDWNFRKEITVSNSGSLQSDYAVLINITYSSEMNSDFSDLRFTNSSGTELGYWIQSSVDSSEAEVWVEVDTLAASGDTSLYMYYGNSGASSESDGELTFEFFDDFSGASIDASKWTESNTDDDFNIESGELVIGPGGSGWSQALSTTESFARSDLVLELDYHWTSNNSGYDALMFGWKDDSAWDSSKYKNLVYGLYNSGTSTCTACDVHVYEDGSGRSGEVGDWEYDTPFRVRIFMNESGGATYEMSSDDGDTWTTSYTSTHSTEASLHPAFVIHTGEHRFDNVRVRKWMDTEPSISFGSEEAKYESSGTLTSNIYDGGYPGSAWDEVTYTTTGSGTLTV